MVINDSFYTTIGVIVSALLTYAAVRYQYSKKAKSPAEILFDAYEAALKDYQVREETRQKQLNDAWTTINNLQADLDKARNVIYTQQQEIDRSRESTDQLMAELTKFKTDYEKMYSQGFIKAVKEGRVK